jgi:CRISPR-associated protein Csm5
MMNLSVKLTTLTPVNIGSGEILSQFCDYVYDKGFIYYLDYDLIAQELAKMPEGDRLIDEFVAIVRTQAGGNVQNRFRIKGFLESTGLDFQNFASKQIAVEDEIKEQIQLQVKTGGRPYVPGSSIKGAIRTAIVSNFFTAELEKNIKNTKEYIGQDILGKYDEDILKFLQVSDTMPFNEEDLGIVRFLRYNLKTGDLDIPVVKEVILSERESSFKISFKAKKGQVPSRFVFLEEGKGEQIFEIINKYSRENVENEIKELNRNKSGELKDVKEFYEELLDTVSTADVSKEAYMRIGSGKTFYDNTVAHKLSQAFLKGIIKQNYRKADPNFFPKTRTVVLHEGKKTAPGWVKLEKV